MLIRPGLDTTINTYWNDSEARRAVKRLQILTLGLAMATLLTALTLATLYVDVMPLLGE